MTGVPEGLRGWLLVLLLYLVFISTTSAWRVLLSVDAVSSLQFREERAVSESERQYLRGSRNAHYAVAAASAVMCVYSIITLALALKRGALAKPALTSCCGAIVVYRVLITGALGLDDFIAAGIYVGVALMWLTYLNRSQRVLNTFARKA